MFEATAVWQTDTKEFKPAGFNIMVEVEPVSTNVMPASMELIMNNITDGRCNGFIIDLGTSKKYIIQSSTSR